MPLKSEYDYNEKLGILAIEGITSKSKRVESHHHFVYTLRQSNVIPN